jgi:hypothetical protein
MKKVFVRVNETMRSANCNTFFLSTYPIFRVLKYLGASKMEKKSKCPPV